MASSSRVVAAIAAGLVAAVVGAYAAFRGRRAGEEDEEDGAFLASPWHPCRPDPVGTAT